jgi:hypothetical protein
VTSQQIPVFRYTIPLIQTGRNGYSDAVKFGSSANTVGYFR